MIPMHGPDTRRAPKARPQVRPEPQRHEPNFELDPEAGEPTHPLAGQMPIAQGGQDRVYRPDPKRPNRERLDEPNDYEGLRRR